VFRAAIDQPAQRGRAHRFRAVGARRGRLTLLSDALGIAGAFFVSRLMRQALFEVDPADPFIYLAVAATLPGVAEFAAWLPARRPTRIDPVIAPACRVT
jgi:hypothetical protein